MRGRLLACGERAAGSLLLAAQRASLGSGEKYVYRIARVRKHWEGVLTVGEKGVADLASGTSNADSERSLLLKGGGRMDVSCIVFQVKICKICGLDILRMIRAGGRDGNLTDILQEIDRKITRVSEKLSCTQRVCGGSECG
jgi:hypothetical protein